MSSGDKASDNSEDVALKAAIEERGKFIKGRYSLFDRGISARKTFQEFKQAGIKFVTRLNDKVNYKIIRSNEQEAEAGRDLEILGDYIVNLRSRDVHWIKEEFRLIKTKHRINGKGFVFLTNLTELSAFEIKDIYKMRWDIEVFFKFIKTTPKC